MQLLLGAVPDEQHCLPFRTSLLFAQLLVQLQADSGETVLHSCCSVQSQLNSAACLSGSACFLPAPHAAARGLRCFSPLRSPLRAVSDDQHCMHFRISLLFASYCGICKLILVRQSCAITAQCSLRQTALPAFLDQPASASYCGICKLILV